MRWLSRSFELLLLVAIVAGNAESRADGSPRLVLATGDVVPGFGAIGSSSFQINGLTNDGRLLVEAVLSDGRQGLYWVKDRQLTAIRTSDQLANVNVAFAFAKTNADGTVLVPAVGPGLPFFYVLAANGAARVLSVPRTDGAGNTICQVDYYRAQINRLTDIVYAAEIAPAGQSCEVSSDVDLRVPAIYRIHNGETSLAVSGNDVTASSPPSDSIELKRLTDDGTIIFTHRQRATNDDVIMAVGNGGIRRIVGPGDLGPSGAPLSGLSTIVANSAGEVAFTASEAGQVSFYRTDSNRLIKIAAGDLSPSGIKFSNIGETRIFNGQGALAITASWYGYRQDGSIEDGQGLIVYPANGSPRIAFRGGRNTGLGGYATTTDDLAVNDGGQIAFGVQVYNGSVGRLALVATTDGLETALNSDDAAPDGALLAAGGLDWYPNLRCLAADGRLAAAARSTTGHNGLLCIDAAGTHLIAQSGDLAPDGWAFSDFSDCRFTEDGALLFAGSTAVAKYGNDSLYSEAAVYRADQSGIERLFGDGDAVSNGTYIEDWGSGVSFVSNSKGHVLSSANARGAGFFLQHDGALDLVRYGTSLQWGLTNGDDAVFIDRVDGWRPNDWPRDEEHAGNALVVWSSGSARIVARITSGTLPGAPFRGFTGLVVRGDLALFTALGRDGQPNRLFSYRIGDPQPLQLPPSMAPEEVLDLTPGGRFLARNGDDYSVESIDGSGHTPVSGPPDLRPSNLNDRGNIALYGYSDPPGSSRTTIRRAGPPADTTGRCQIPPTIGSQPSRSPTSTPTPRQTPTPVHGSGPYRLYISDTANDTVVVVDTTTEETLARITVPHFPRRLAAAPDGSRIFVLGEDTVGVIDAVHLQLVQRLPLGEAALRIVAAPDNVHAFVDTYQYATGLRRFAVVDGVAGLVTSIFSNPKETLADVSPDGSTLFATSTSGNPCDSQSRFDAIDAATGSLLHGVETGQAAVAARVSADGTHAYVTDSCTNQLVAVDVSSNTVVGSYQLDLQPREVAVSRDATWAYTTHYGSSGLPNGDGTYSTHGRVSAIELSSGRVDKIDIDGGSSLNVAVAPDGRRVYVTLEQFLYGRVDVIDTQTNSVVSSILAASGAGDVVVAPVPDLAPPTATPGSARIVLRVDTAVGVVGDDVPLSIRIDSGGLGASAIEHDLITGPNVPLAGTPSGLPDCHVAPELEGIVRLELAADSCAYRCDSVHVRLIAAQPGGRLPDAGLLYTCVANLSYPSQGPRPVLLTNASAVGVDGQALPIATSDGELRVLSRDEATPRPTRTPFPTTTRVNTYTPTATPLPVVVEVVSASFTGTLEGTLSLRLNTHGAVVAGVQNDLTFPAGARVVAAGGKPLCTVNAAINKPTTTFAFRPPGCDAEHGDCTGLRAVLFALDNVDAIADDAELYTCRVGADAAGAFPFRVSGLYASSPSGASLPVIGVDGTIIFDVDAPAPGSPAATATATASPAPASTPPPDGIGAAAPAVGPGATGGGGCAIGGASRGSAALILLLLPPFVWRWSKRGAGSIAARRPPP
jgi:YVTN family beta-propeller protein